MDELTRELDKTKAPNDGGPAFPLAPVADPETGQFIGPHSTGMSLRDWFAGTIGFKTDEIEIISKCDDDDLLDRFGTDKEKERGFQMCFPAARSLERTIAGSPEIGGEIPFYNIELRANLEARARAHLRYLESDAMLRAREAKCSKD